MADYSITVVKTLFALSGNTCAYRGCEQTLTNPAWEQVNADIAHIRGRSPGGPRYDATIGEADLYDFPNLIVLCPNCHRRVDRLEPEKHTVELLEQMKADHEGRAEPQEWASQTDLAKFAQLAIQLATRIENTEQIVPLSGTAVVEVGATGALSIEASPGSIDIAPSIQPSPRLTLSLTEGRYLDVENIGEGDAFGITLAPIVGRSVVDPAVIPPPRLPHGKTWRAGMLKHTEGPELPVTVRLRWKDQRGAAEVEDFNFER